MKIRSIEPIQLRIPFKGGALKTGFGDKPWAAYDMLLVRVETDDGLVGWGESWGYGIIPGTRATLEAVVAPHFIGRDAVAFEPVLDEMRHKFHLFGRNGTINYALAGIEIALWDIRGKRAGKPLHALIGGALRRQFSAYASLLPYRDPALVATITRKAIGEGYTSVKLHEIDVPQVRAAREAGGPGLEIMLDTNCPWSLPQAREMAGRLRDCDIHWLEEPVWPPENFSALARLKRDAGIPIAAGENVGTVREFETLLAQEAVDYAMPSVTKIGGIGEALKVYEAALDRRVAVAPHSPYLGPGLAATLHLAATLPEAVRIERVYVELEASPFGPLGEVRSGSMTLPESHGLGADPEAALLERYRVKETHDAA
jgi:D-galactarolactone cycloisomerase